MTALKDALKSAALVWLFTTIGLWIPGLLGWVNEVSSWAAQKGAPAFPDPSNLGFLFVAALTAAFPAAVAGLVRFFENASGHAILPRSSSAPTGTAPVRTDRGASDLVTVLAAVLLVLLIVVVLARVL